jgi:hypothetical protein
MVPQRLVRVYTSTKVLGTNGFGIENKKGTGGDITPCTRRVPVLSDLSVFGYFRVT